MVSAKPPDIEASEPCDRFVDQRTDVILLANVSVDELGLRTESSQFFGERVASAVAPSGNDDSCALAGKGDGGGAADCRSVRR
jgi:hypothetical protein